MNIEYCSKCGKAKRVIHYSGPAFLEDLNLPNTCYPNTYIPLCCCPPEPTSSQPIASWTEEQLRAFIAQEVAKALRPPVIQYHGNEESLREHIAKGGYPQLMFPEDAVSVFQEVPAKEVTQTFEEIEPEYSETNRKLAEM